jgi:hypothetical protein
MTSRLPQSMKRAFTFFPLTKSKDDYSTEWVLDTVRHHRELQRGHRWRDLLCLPSWAWPLRAMRLFYLKPNSYFRVGWRSSLRLRSMRICPWNGPSACREDWWVRSWWDWGSTLLSVPNEPSIQVPYRVTWFHSLCLHRHMMTPGESTAGLVLLQSWSCQ